MPASVSLLSLITAELIRWIVVAYLLPRQRSANCRAKKSGGFGSVTTVKLGQALVGQNAEQLLREADLRYSLVRLRENAESIAFYGGESREEAEVSSRLQGAVENKRAILGTQRNLEFFTTAYSYLVQILPVLVAYKVTSCKLQATSYKLRVASYNASDLPKSQLVTPNL